MMDNLKLMYSGEIDGIIPEKIDYLVLLEIMKGIIKRNGNIRNLIKIVEVVEKEYCLNGNFDVNNIVEKVLDIQ